MGKINGGTCQHKWVSGYADRGVRKSGPSIERIDGHSTMIPMKGWNDFEAHGKTIAEHCSKCLLEKINGKDGKKRYSGSVRNQAIKNPKFLRRYLADIKNHPNPSVYKGQWMDAISGANFTANHEIPSIKEVQKFMRLEKEGQKENKK